MLGFGSGCGCTVWLRRLGGGPGWLLSLTACGGPSGLAWADGEGAEEPGLACMLSLASGWLP